VSSPRDAPPPRPPRQAKFGLRADVLQLHGKARVDYFYTPHTRELVRQGWWKHDCKQFSEY